MKYFMIFVGISLLKIAQEHTKSKARENLWPLRTILFKTLIHQSSAMLMATALMFLAVYFSSTINPVMPERWVGIILLGCYSFIIAHTAYETHTEVECERIERGNT